MLATAESLGSLAAREQRGGRLSTAAILVGPATIFVTIGLLLPILLLFRYSLNAFVPGKLMVEALTPENYVLFVTDPYYLAAFTRTLRVAAIVTVLCVVLAFPLAYKLARTQIRFKNLLVMLVVLPLVRRGLVVIPPAVFSLVQPGSLTAQLFCLVPKAISCLM